MTAGGNAQMTRNRARTDAYLYWFDVVFTKTREMLFSGSSPDWVARASRFGYVRESAIHYPGLDLPSGLRLSSLVLLLSVASRWRARAISSQPLNRAGLTSKPPSPWA